MKSLFRAWFGVSGLMVAWKVSPLDSSGMRFSLQGVHGVGGAASIAVDGLVVPVASMPDCHRYLSSEGEQTLAFRWSTTPSRASRVDLPPGECIPYGCSAHGLGVVDHRKASVCSPLMTGTGAVGMDATGTTRPSTAIEAAPPTP